MIRDHLRRDRLPTPVFLGFPGGSAGKESSCNVGDLGSIPGLGKSPGEGKGYLLQYLSLEDSMDCMESQRVRHNWVTFTFFHHGTLELSKLIKYRKQACSVAKSCPTLCNPMDCSPPGSSVHEIFQVRILEWVAMPSSRGSSRPRDRTCISSTCRQILYYWATWEARQAQRRMYWWGNIL